MIIPDHSCRPASKHLADMSLRLLGGAACEGSGSRWGPRATGCCEARFGFERRWHCLARASSGDAGFASVRASLRDSQTVARWSSTESCIGLRGFTVGPPCHRLAVGWLSNRPRFGRGRRRLSVARRVPSRWSWLRESCPTKHRVLRRGTRAAIRRGSAREDGLADRYS